MSHISRQFLNNAVLLHRQGQLAASIRQCDLVLAAEPRNFDALHLKGLALYQLGSLDESLRLLTKSIKENPSSAQAFNNRGLIHQRCVRKKEALNDFERAIGLNGNLAEAHCNRGNILRELGRLDEAAEACLAAIKINPPVAEFHNSLGVVRRQVRDWQSALHCFDRALELRPSYLEALINRGNVLKEMDRFDEAIKSYEEATALRPDYTEAYVNRGNALREIGRLDDAFASYQKAISQRADHPHAWLGLAKIDLELGRFEEAEAKYTKANELAPTLVDPLYGLAWVKKYSADDPLIKRLEQRLTDSRLTVEDQAWLQAAYAKVSDDVGRYDDAFKHFAIGKALRKSQFDMAHHLAAHAAMRELFTREFFADRRSLGQTDERPVFIVGMPRSGTTLVEQILASHRDVEGRGELLEMSKIANGIGGGLSSPERFLRELARLQADDLTRMAERYLKAYAGVSEESLRLVDKMPHNFQLLGLIALIFPNAHIIHCRRDPLDTCVSIYMQRYSKDHGYADDLATLGRYYRDYERLMVHWREVLPVEIHDCVYEDLVGDFEVSVASLLSFVRLAWDPNCLEYHRKDRAVRTASLWQVRQPPYKSSINRWRRYEKHLAPLRDALLAT
jgi:tetratricopeptide (TPR) repeat protein